MRAVVLSSGDEPPRVTDVRLDPPKAGEVRVRVGAAGVCHSDLHVRKLEWDVPLPLVMGHEGSGVVMELGPGVTSLSEGDHVILSWEPACGRCRACLAGRPSQCEVCAGVVWPKGVLYDGTTRFRIGDRRAHHYIGVSSFSEETVVPETGAIRVGTNVPLDAAALMGCCVPTGVGAVLWTARMPPGSTAVVIGCGAVGLCAVQGAVLGAASRIVAVDLLPHKLDAAKTFGATDVVDASAVNAVEAVREITGGGADFVFDCIGLVSTAEQSIAMLSLGGTAVIVGLAPTGAMARFEPRALAEAEQRIVGSNYGSVRPALDFPFLVDLYRSGRLKVDELITTRRPLEEVEQAFDDMIAGRVIRTVLDPSLWPDRA
jgi:S-(hydroxymethyl)glutathione dehydrogenase / alcohol dehydrogenase